MTNEELAEQVNLLRESFELQIDVTAALAIQLANVQAQLETVLATQREILTKHGVSKEQTTASQKAAHQAGVVVRTDELKGLLARLQRIDPESGAPPASLRN